MMKMKSLKIVAFLLAIYISVACGVCYVGASTLTPNEDGVYEIATYEQLCIFADLVNGTGVYSLNGAVSNANAVLTNTIISNEGLLDENGDLTEGEFAQWKPMANYSGTFDGNGYGIVGLYIEAMEKNQGLFSNIEIGGKVKNLEVARSYICGEDRVGIISAVSYGDIENCSVSGSAAAICCIDGVGGVVGISYGNVYNCSNAAMVFAVSDASKGYCGGIAGVCEGEIVSCANYGQIVITDACAGGICGVGNNIIDSYNVGSVTGVTFAGGIAGEIYGKIENCYHYGELFVNVDTAKSGYYGMIAGFCYTTSDIEESFVNNYYSGSGIFGLGGYSTDGQVAVTDKDITENHYAADSEFANGHVAYMLGDGYGMLLGSDKYPLRADEYNKIYQIGMQIVPEYGTLYGMIDGYANSAVYVVADERYGFVGWFADDICVTATPWISTETLVKTNASAAIYQKGDLNGNGVFDSKDVIKCKKTAADAFGIWYSVADVDCNGLVDENDVKLIADMLNI